MKLTEILPRAANAYPNKLAIVCGDVRLSYRGVRDRVAKLCSGLLGMGLGPGERVALLHRNCHRVLEAYFAAVHAGGVLVPLNYRLTARDLAYILDETESGFLIADTGWASLALGALGLTRSKPKLIWSVCGDDDTSQYGEAEYENFLKVADAHMPVDTDAREDDPVNIYYTSGTTGHQKGVVLTHRNIYSHGLGTVADLKLSDNDVWAHLAPMFHLADAWAIWAMTWVGARHVMMGKFDPGSVIRELVEESVTATNLIPTMLNDLVNHPDASNREYKALRLMMSGGAPIAPSLVRRVIETFGCEYVQTYGLTETSPYLTFSLLKDHLQRLSPEEQMRYRAKTGRAALGVTLRVVDDAGHDIPADEKAVGEIVARGDRITPGYWKLSEATAEAFRGGWFHTGDLATIDTEGYLNIVDRKKDAILTGGELVYSTEVENVLYEHGDVLEAAVVGVPDERWGEAIKAVVVLKEGRRATAEELMAHCRERLARYKCPRSVDFVAALPRTGSGKISKKEIREPYWTGHQKRVG